MKVLVLIALCLAAAVSANVQKPHAVPMRDIPILPGQKIVGGMETDPHTYKHQLVLNINGFFSCGASLICPNFIMTAAHCAESAASAYEVIAGAHNRLEDEPEQQSRTVLTITKHPGWNPNTLADDIAIMELSSPFDDSVHVVPGTLVAAGNCPAAGEIVTPSGWGKTSDGIFGQVSDVLMHVDVPVLSMTECQNVYGGIITENIVCTDGDGGMGTCNGDSGGPLNTADDTIAGVVSFGSSAGCAQNYPAGFTNVCMYIDFIQSVTGGCANVAK